METDFKTFLCQWKPLLKSDGIQFLNNIPAGESVFLPGETDFLARGNQFFSPFVIDFW